MMGDPLMRAICTDPTNNPAWVTRQLTGVSGDMAGVSSHSTRVSVDIMGVTRPIDWWLVTVREYLVGSVDDKQRIADRLAG
jgi:hypothetical protein